MKKNRRKYQRKGQKKPAGGRALCFTYIKEYPGLFTQKITKQFGTRRRPELGKRLILDLPDPLTGKTETLADILQTHRVIYTDAEEQAYNLFLPVGKNT